MSNAIDVCLASHLAAWTDASGRGFLGDVKILPNPLKPDPPVRLRLDEKSLLWPVCSCSKNVSLLMAKNVLCTISCYLEGGGESPKTPQINPSLERSGVHVLINLRFPF